MTTPPPKQPHIYLSLDQVREFRLLSPERMAEVEAEIERRISIPRDEQGRPIETARLADLSPWPRYLYARMDHDLQWMYIRREIMGVVLTDAEREMLNRHGLSAAETRKDAERFEKATKVQAADWDGWVTDGNEYWDSVESYLDAKADYLEDEGEEWQHRYLWAARPQQVIIGRDAADIFESQMCDRGWEDISPDAFTGWGKLQEAVDAFVKENEAVVSYEQDYKTAILLDDHARDYARRMREANEECNRTGIHPIHQR